MPSREIELFEDFDIDGRSCSACHFGGCDPEEDGGYYAVCNNPQCTCVCRVAPLPRPVPGTQGYGAVIVDE